ncbi:MAG: hypothetical protein RIS94_665 [Pseudomonadota bacterium]
MKLASLPQARDGRLIVVSDDLAWYADADHIVPTLQALLDGWDRHAPLLESLAIELAHEVIPRKRFHEREAAAPLPRCPHRAGGSDSLHAAREAFALADESWGAASAPAVVVVTGDIAQGASADQARAQIRLVGLTHEIVLAAAPSGADAHPASFCSPVFVTPESLGDAWQHGALCCPVLVDRAGAQTWVDPARVDFGERLAALAATRALSAGALVGVALPSADAAPLARGETVAVDARDGRGHSLFGKIEQKIAAV